MKNINAIGLNTKKAEQLAEKLNDLLANYTIFYQNVRGYHWNIAERILTLGYAPEHNYSAYKKV